MMFVVVKDIYRLLIADIRLNLAFKIYHRHQLANITTLNGENFAYPWISCFKYKKANLIGEGFILLTGGYGFMEGFTIPF